VDNPDPIQSSRVFLHWTQTLTLSLVCLFLVACGSQSDREREIREQLKQERLARDSIADTVGRRYDEAEVLQMVQQSTAPVEGQTCEEWVRELTKDIRGDVLFPSWRATPRGSNKYEVRFTYTLMGVDNTVTRQGWAWKVDMVLKLVSSPQELEAEDISHLGRTLELDQRRRETIDMK